MGETEKRRKTRCYLNSSEWKSSEFGVGEKQDSPLPASLLGGDKRRRGQAQGHRGKTEI